MRARSVPSAAVAVNASAAAVASLEAVEQGLRLEQVDAAVDEVDDRLQLGLFLDLLLDEPLQELVAAVIAGRRATRGHPVELGGDLPLGLERPLPRRLAPTRSGSTRP